MSEGSRSSGLSVRDGLCYKRRCTAGESCTGASSNRFTSANGGNDAEVVGTDLPDDSDDFDMDSGPRDAPEDTSGTNTTETACERPNTELPYLRWRRRSVFPYLTDVRAIAKPIQVVRDTLGESRIRLEEQSARCSNFCVFGGTKYQRSTAISIPGGQSCSVEWVFQVFVRDWTCGTCNPHRAV